ncbi:hypothetical protein D3C81_904360 [compost metagenome]
MSISPPQKESAAAQQEALFRQEIEELYNAIITAKSLTRDRSNKWIIKEENHTLFIVEEKGITKLINISIYSHCRIELELDEFHLSANLDHAKQIFTIGQWWGIGTIPIPGKRLYNVELDNKEDVLHLLRQLLKLV